jgi:L-alanine-DL-glutamate epimerase-like enolase superfamily enzyme
VSKLTLTVAHESWPIAGSFTISRDTKTKADVVVVTLSEDGVVGRGECVPYPRYHETVPQVMAALEGVQGRIEAGHLPQDQIPLYVAPRAAQNALDCAMWDLKAKRSGKPVWQLAGLSEPKAVITAYTLSLDTPEAMASAARDAADRPLLKLKLGREGDEERIDAIRRAAPKARLIVDANEGWNEAALPRMLAACAKASIELVEQPLPATADEALRNIDRVVPICADESAHDVDGIQALFGKYDAINIKLDKTGGLTGALGLAVVAQDNDLKIMIGCMLATSLAMAPAMLLAQFASVVDLDGPLLLKQDRSPGITYAGSLMHPPPRALWG